MGFEHLKGFVKGALRDIRRKGTLYQFFNAVANKAAYSFFCVLLTADLAHGIIGAGGKIVKGVKQCPVQVENAGGI